MKYYTGRIISIGNGILHLQKREILFLWGGAFLPGLIIPDLKSPYTAFWGGGTFLPNFQTRFPFDKMSYILRDYNPI